MDNGYTCYQCGKAGHVASGCPGMKAWVDCAECGRPGHPKQGDLSRDGAWFCLDCQDPSWRTRLNHSDPRHRAPDQPLAPTVADPGDRPEPPLINEPGDLRKMNVDQCAHELASLRQPMFPPQPPSPAREAALRELALRQAAGR